MYLTYEEYLEYGGELNESTFNQLEFKCRKRIDYLTANRVSRMKVIPEAVKRCIFELTNQEEIYNKNAQAYYSFESTGKMVSSFSTDGYSETYGGGSGGVGTYLKELRASIDELQTNTIKNMLAYERDDFGTKLLYRGVYDEVVK